MTDTNSERKPKKDMEQAVITVVLASYGLLFCHTCFEAKVTASSSGEATSPK